MDKAIIDGKEITFVEFLTNIFTKMGGVKPAFCAELLQNENIKLFRTAFTDSSFDSTNNYEYLEFLGDGCIGEFSVFYITDRFPYVTSPKWLTRIKHNMISKKSLAYFSRKYHFEHFIRIAPLFFPKKKKTNPINVADIRNLLSGMADINQIAKQSQVLEYLSILEDVVEAFVGCISFTINKMGKSHGLAVQIIHNILSYMLDREEISLDYKVVFDPITRLKELYDKLRWLTNQTYNISKNETLRNVTIDVYGFPGGQRTKLVSVTGLEQDFVKLEVAEKALKVLEEKYGIKEDILPLK